MSEFKECDHLLEEFTPTDESTIAGGSGYYRKRHRKRRRRRKFPFLHFFRKYRYGH